MDWSLFVYFCVKSGALIFDRQGFSLIDWLIFFERAAVTVSGVGWVFHLKRFEIVYLLWFFICKLFWVNFLFLIWILNWIERFVRHSWSVLGHVVERISTAVAVGSRRVTQFVVRLLADIQTSTLDSSFLFFQKCSLFAYSSGATNLVLRPSTHTKRTCFVSLTPAVNFHNLLNVSKNSKLFLKSLQMAFLVT